MRLRVHVEEKEDRRPFENNPKISADDGQYTHVECIIAHAITGPVVGVKV